MLRVVIIKRKWLQKKNHFSTVWVGTKKSTHFSNVASSGSFSAHSCSWDMCSLVIRTMSQSVCAALLCLSSASSGSIRSTKRWMNFCSFSHCGNKMQTKIRLRHIGLKPRWGLCSRQRCRRDRPRSPRPRQWKFGFQTRTTLDSYNTGTHSKDKDLQGCIWHAQKAPLPSSKEDLSLAKQFMSPIHTWSFSLFFIYFFSDGIYARSLHKSGPSFMNLLKHKSSLALQNCTYRNKVTSQTIMSHV